MKIAMAIARNTKFLLPKDLDNQDKFIGLWLNAQKKAINKVMKESTFKNFDPDIVVLTVTSDPPDPSVDETYSTTTSGVTPFVESLNFVATSLR